jgi:NAD-dependent dihydropyrimidine dehydrogenase PreA subunit
MDDVYFACLQVQDRQAVKRAAEEASIGWQNDKYTGHLHTANNNRLKINLAECGALDDFDESDATESEDGSQGERTKKTRTRSEKECVLCSSCMLQL